MTAPDSLDVQALERIREQLQRAEETGDLTILDQVFADDISS